MNFYKPEFSVDEKRLTVSAPYNSGFQNSARRLGGVFKDRHWLFSKRDEIAVRNACLEHYGVDGIEDPVAVDVQIDVTARIQSDAFRPITIFARPIARVTKKGNAPLIAQGMIISKGEIDSRGPIVIIEPGCSFIFREVPLCLYQKQKTLHQQLRCSILDIEDSSLEYLFYEHDRLVQKLSEIKAIFKYADYEPELFQAEIKARESSRYGG